MAIIVTSPDTAPAASIALLAVAPAGLQRHSTL